jgi:NodT family efflux transporter outer membrane factor (OMF) lipoprotein
MRIKWMIVVFLTAIGLTGCMTVGPNYTPPETPAADQWHSPLAGGLQAGPSSPQILAQWWSTLNDPILTTLMERAVAGNLSLKEAQARIREARARMGVSRADRFPTVTASASGAKSRSSENTGSGQDHELYDAGFDAAWELDLFGGVRRSVEAAQADIEAAQASRDDILVSLLAETARNYVQARTLQKQLDVAQANLQAQEDTYEITRSRFEAGLSSELPLQQATYNLSSTRSKIPTLDTALEAAKNRLAVLIGESPGKIHGLMDEHRSIPVTPPAVTVGIPADTLRQRPDIRNAERQLAAQTARIGVATADLYPSLRLTGSIGLEALVPGDLFTTASRTWHYGAGLSWSIFNGGAIRSNIAIQTVKQEELFYQYRSTVLSALEEVENNLTAYAAEQVRRQSLITAREAAQRAASLAQDQYKAGLVGFSDVLDAQRSVLSFEDQLAQSEGTVTTNLIALYKSLGGGWSAEAAAAQGENNRPETADQK